MSKLHREHLDQQVEFFTGRFDRTTMKNRRRGLSYAEVLVSATVLTTIMSLVTVSSFRISRVWKDVQHQRIAVNELSDQLDRLTMSPVEEIEDLIDSLEASKECQSQLADPQLNGLIETEEEIGHRLTLLLTWQNHLGERSKPETLSAWWPRTGESEDSEE